MAGLAGNITFIGSDNDTTPDTFANQLDLFLKVFSGEVLTTYERRNKIRDKVRVRTIKSGKSAQFPAIGKMVAAYHLSGISLVDPNVDAASGTPLLTNVLHGEQEIFIDRKLIAGALIDELEEVQNHYEIRQDYAEEIGRALATTDDKQLLQVIALGARATAAVTTDHTLGAVIMNNSALQLSTDVGLFIDAVRAAAVKMDQNDVPLEDRFIALPPVQYHRLVDNGEAINRDFNPDSNGSRSAGVIERIFGFEIIKTNNLPQSTIATNLVGIRNTDTYGGVFDLTLAVCFHTTAVGTVRMMGMTSSVDWLPTLQAWQLLGKQAVGHGVLREGACIEINDDDEPTSTITNKQDMDDFL